MTRVKSAKKLHKSLWKTATVAAFSMVGTFAQAENISYKKDIRPILDNKCVACHACFAAACQLNLTNSYGIKRGATKFNPQALRFLKAPHFEFDHSPLSIEETRKLGFFSVIEGGVNSLMGKMLALGHANKWKPNEKIPAGFQMGDPVLAEYSAPTLKEFDGYARAFPMMGMPYAVTGLEDKEYATLMKWLEQGAKFDDVAPLPTTFEDSKVKEWEEFLNQSDNEHKLVARYVYEHFLAFHLYFEKNAGDAPKNYYSMVRSSTPPGEKIKVISSRYANSPIKQPFYYRLAIIDWTITRKNHNAVNSTARLDTINELFFNSEKWSIDKLPGYTDKERYNPLATFNSIPAKARYKFLLGFSAQLERAIMQASSCRGNFNNTHTPDRGWVLYENPDTSPFVNDKALRDKLLPKLGLAGTDDDHSIGSALVQVQADTNSLNAAYREAAERLDGGNYSKITDIWKGSKPGDKPIVTMINNKDNSDAAYAFVGDYPTRVVLQNLPSMENETYIAYVNFDLFAKMDRQLVLTNQYGMWRTASEINYLRFLPPKTRMEVLTEWYSDPFSTMAMTAQLHGLANEKLMPDIDYKTDNPKVEFLKLVMEHLKDTAQTEDPISRPKPGVEYDAVTKAFQKLNKAGDKVGAKFKLFLPEASIIKVIGADKETKLYTLTLDWHVPSRINAAQNVGHIYPLKDQITIYPGLLTSYPNFIFKIDEKEVGEFADQLAAVETEEAFEKVAVRWGIRRTNPDIWKELHSITAIEAKTRPHIAASLDMLEYGKY